MSHSDDDDVEERTADTLGEQGTTVKDLVRQLSTLTLDKQW